MSDGASLAAVESELRRLWSEAAASAREQGEPLLRASVVNLVVVTDGPRAVADVTLTLSEVAASVPGRMIVVAPDPFEPEGLDAWPSIQCRAAGERGAQAGASLVCCEQVVVHVRGPAVGELPALVRPLLETDLPSVLWWRAPVPVEWSVLDRLAGEVQTVIVDTARGAVWADGVTPGGDPVAAVGGLLTRRGVTHSQRPGSGPRRPWTLRDLAFARLTPWRELTAALFDIVPCREMLGRIQSVTVAGRPGAPEVRLYVGWLASRLGWKATGPGSPVARTYERPGGGRLTVRVAPVEEGTALARAAFEGPGVHAWVQLGETTPAGERLEAAAAIEGAAPVSQVVAVAPMTDARLVEGELTMTGNDRVYEAAVQAVIR